MLKPLTLALALFALPLSGCERTNPMPDPPLMAQAATADAFSSEVFTLSVSGAGPNVILVPGLASNAAIWDDAVVALQATHTVHVVQVSGFGGALARGNQGNSDILDDLAADLATYTRTLEGDTVLVGHSLGGLVTLKTVLSPDHRVDEIVVIDVLPFFSVLMDPAATADTMAPIAQFMKATLLAQSEDIFAARQDEALAGLVKGEANRALALSWSVDSDRAVMAQAMSEVLVTDLRPQMADILVPATIIYARDPAIPNMDAVEAFYRDLYAPIPQAKLVAVDDALHFIMMDQPEAFLAALTSALSD